MDGLLIVSLKSYPSDDTQIHNPHSGTSGGGGGGKNSPKSFWYVAVLGNDFTFGGKPLIFLRRWAIFNGWWHCWRPGTVPTMVAILDFTKN